MYLFWFILLWNLFICFLYKIFLLIPLPITLLLSPLTFLLSSLIAVPYFLPFFLSSPSSLSAINTLFVLSCPKNLNHAIQLSSQYNKIKWNQLKIELRIGSLVSFFDRFLQHNIMYFCTNKDFVVCCIRIVALCVMPCLHIMFLPHCLESWMQHSLWITQSRRIFSDEMKQNKKENLKQRCHKGFCFYACLLLMCWSVLHHDIQTHIYIHVSIKEQICLIANNFFDQLVQSQSPWSWTTFLY